MFPPECPSSTFPHQREGGDSTSISCMVISHISWQGSYHGVRVIYGNLLPFLMSGAGENYVMCVSPYPHVRQATTNRCLYWIGTFANLKFDIQNSHGTHAISLALSSSPVCHTSTSTNPIPRMQLHRQCNAIVLTSSALDAAIQPHYIGCFGPS
jgi:hypothetical protein